MKTMSYTLLLICVPVILFNLASCGSDEPADNGTAGTGGASGNSGNPWQSGKVGNASKVSTIMKNGGPVLAIDIQENAKPMMKTMDWDPDSGLPPTIPTVDFSEATPNSVLVMEVPPYYDYDTMGEAYPPYTTYIYPDGTIEVQEHFPNWADDFTMGCYGIFSVEINGFTLLTSGGVVWDVASGLGRNFLITSADDCVYELLPNGQTAKLACGLEGPASLMMHPMGFLVITTLPGYVKNLPDALPEKPVELFKLTVDNPVLTKLAEMPVHPEYDTDLSMCHEFPFTEYAMPMTLRNHAAVMGNGDYIVADIGGLKLYQVSSDGSLVQEYAEVSKFLAALTIAPNDVIYGVFPPLYGDKNDGSPTKVIRGATINALDPNTKTWIQVTELPEYELFEGDMSWGMHGVPCDPEYVAQGYALCLYPVGAFMKIVPGQTPTNPYLLVSDPVTTRIFQVVLNYGTDSDAGAGGSSGAAGSSGSAGASGTAGSAGIAGSAGTSGTSGSAGSSGIAGSGG